MAQLSLFECATSLDTLRAAWQRVHTKGSQGGRDGVTVADFARDSDAELEKLRREFVEERYVPRPLREIAIPKGPQKGGCRALRLPSVRDKIAQQAVRSVLEPRLDRTFLDCSYGYRPGRGAERAIKCVSHNLTHRGRRWIATADIHDFFGSLDQKLLLAKLSAAICDNGILRLVQLWLQMGAVDGRGHWHDVYSGVGQGGVISPLLANFYLHPFDQSMTSQGFALVRYADDFVILELERERAEHALRRATEFLQQRLKLSLNQNATPIHTADEGFTFLGVCFRGIGRTLDEVRLTAMTRKLERWFAPGQPFVLAHSVREVAQVAEGWRRYYGRLLPAGEAQRMDDVLRNALVRIFARGFDEAAIKTIGDAEHGLAQFPFVRRPGSKEQGECVRQIALAAHEQRLAGARPALSTAAARPRERKVSADVRRMKRQHYHAQSRVSDLVVTTPGHFIGKSGERVVVRFDRRIVCELPSRQLTSVTVASHGVSLSTDVVALCAERAIPLFVLGEQDVPCAMLTGGEQVDGPLGVLQLQAVAAGSLALELGKRFAASKIRGQLNVMKSMHKYRKRVSEEFSATFARYLISIEGLLGELRAISVSTDLALGRNRVLSVEGRAAAGYWELVATLLRGHADFTHRERRGARDIVNSMLNYGYAILQSRVHLAIVKAGLTPQIGFLHAAQPGKATLVFDLMEEFRAHVVDRSVLRLFARNEPVALDENGRLDIDTRRRLIRAIHERLATLIRHRGREVTVGEIIDQQARAVAAHLRSKRGYRGFVGRW